MGGECLTPTWRVQGSWEAQASLVHPNQCLLSVSQGTLVPIRALTLALLCVVALYPYY